MKKLTTFLLIAALICLLAIPAAATTELSIVRQPQNPTVIEYGLAEYEIKAYGYNLYCTWYMEYQGKAYDISDTSVGIQPWEPYAGETYGDLDPEVNGAFTTFRYFFGGIGPELDGAKIYAVITNGHNEITSQKACIRVVEDAGTPPVIMVSSGMEVYQGEPLELYCEASDPVGGTLSYLWYETTTGELEDIIAVNRGAEDKDTLHVDTSTPGTYYYVCGVDTSNGGSAYSSVIPVTVYYKQNDIPVRYTEDSRSLVGYTMTVDIMAMMDQDARIWNAVLENRVQYQWYQDGQAIDGATSKALKLEDTQDGKLVHVVVTCDDLVISGLPFEVTKEQSDIPADPSDPTVPVDPTDPADPTVPVAPTDPVEPVDPTQKPAESDSSKDNNADQAKAGLPGWSYIIIAVVAAGIMVALIFTLKKKRIGT